MRRLAVRVLGILLLLGIAVTFFAGKRKPESVQQEESVRHGQEEKGHAPPADVWKVYKGEETVLEVRNEPGYLVSTALLPPGHKPVKHPFLSARALNSFEEDKLRRILEQARTFEQFLGLLRANGYRVEKSK